jgi:hypothetical protein
MSTTTACRTPRLFASMSALLVTLSSSMLCRPAAADEVARPARPMKDVSKTKTRPRTTLLKSGAVLLGVPYVSSVVVGATSERKGDQHLFVPVAGPWMDISDRDCTTNQKCKNEGLYKGLLIADGVFQGLGALQIVGAFLLPETVTARKTAASATHRSTKPREGVHVRLAPGGVGGGYGLLARGTF